MAEWKFGYDLAEIDFCELYILDGIPYDQHTIDTALTHYRKTDFSRITFIKETKERTYLHKPCDLFVVLSTAQQTTKEKEALLTEITDFYNEKVPEVRIRDFLCKDCKPLSVNGRFPMLPYDAKEFLNSIKVDQIKHIAIYDEPLNVDFFGSAYKNGLIEMTLY